MIFGLSVCCILLAVMFLIEIDIDDMNAYRIVMSIAELMLVYKCLNMITVLDKLGYF